VGGRRGGVMEVRLHVKGLIAIKNTNEFRLITYSPNAFKRGLYGLRSKCNFIFIF